MAVKTLCVCVFHNGQIRWLQRAKFSSYQCPAAAAAVVVAAVAEDCTSAPHCHAGLLHCFQYGAGIRSSSHRRPDVEVDIFHSVCMHLDNGTGTSKTVYAIALCDNICAWMFAKIP